MRLVLITMQPYRGEGFRYSTLVVFEGRRRFPVVLSMAHNHPTQMANDVEHVRVLPEAELTAP